MYVKINRNVCDHQLAICERCLGKFLQNPFGYERQCFEQIVDDGKENITIDLHTGDEDVHMELTLGEAKMMAAARKIIPRSLPLTLTLTAPR